jgi:hypothetical protein
VKTYFGDIGTVRVVFQHALAAIYLIAFLVALNQFKPLLGERGLLPVPNFLRRNSFRSAPSIFCWRYSDRLLDVVAWSGIVLSTIALSGVSDKGPYAVSLLVWLGLWVLYISIVNVGQTFYAFGWESMLLEAGFFGAFLGPAWMQSPLIPMLCLRWMLFRTEFGAGLIKLRHDRCWRDLTCLLYHYETQPMPNPLSWYFHRMPAPMHRFGVLFSHFVQLVVPFGLFAPQPYALISGSLIIFHQLWLIVSGNYSWLNWLTVILGITALNDSVIWTVLTVESAPTIRPTPTVEVLMYLLGGATILLSIQPVRNLFSKNQLMNHSYNPLHLVNTYGAFGSVTRKRYEIVIEATDDSEITSQTQWQEYGFKGKPGNVSRLPPQIAPYHLRLDWLLWFIPFSVSVTKAGIDFPGYERWFLTFIQRLLECDRSTLKLLRTVPFRNRRPTFVRALFYRYRYADSEKRRRSGDWWTRELVGVYLPAVSLSMLEQSRKKRAS